ncbi:MAG: hypothetical protein ACP5GX_00190 [Anaerolineae bacterium]
MKSESLDDSGSIVHTYGESTSVILLKISSAGESVYDFLDVTEANVAYWQGHQTTAVYTRTVDLPPSGVTPFSRLSVHRLQWFCVALAR